MPSIKDKPNLLLHVGMKLKTLVINLNDSRDRLEAIKDAFSQHDLDFTRIEAVDGRSQNALNFPQYNDCKSNLRHGKSLSGGEVACYLSHISALKAFLDSGDECGLILEDDATPSDDLGVQIKDLVRKLHELNKWDVVNLTVRRDTWMKPYEQTASNELRRAFYFPMLATANLWSRRGAIAFLNGRYGKEINGPFDTELRSFCALRGKGLSLAIPIVTPSGAPSDIDSSSKDYQKNLRNPGRRTIKSALTRHWPDHALAAFHYLTSKD